MLRARSFSNFHPPICFLSFFSLSVFPFVCHSFSVYLSFYFSIFPSSPLCSGHSTFQHKAKQNIIGRLKGKSEKNFFKFLTGGTIDIKQV
jgi:hypothetical protein